jgi:hypothetical protein
MRQALLAAAVFLLAAFSLAADAPSVASLPPVVVATTPRSGDLAVDAGLKEIRVTFSKDMMTEDMWSWVQVSEITFPKVTAKSHYLDDKRTCVLPVKLEPGKTYAIWINSPAHDAFRDKGGQPAVPYLLAFQTKP